jgi:septal ring factor EnvC (AmiA/AmiB activator)
MDDATRSSCRYQISRGQQRINQLDNDRAALMQRIYKLEDGKAELDRLRSRIHNDVSNASSGLSQIPNVTNLNSAQQISPKIYEYYDLTWADNNLRHIGNTMMSADNEISDIWDAIRSIDSSIGQQHAVISSLQRQLSQ